MLYTTKMENLKGFKVQIHITFSNWKIKASIKYKLKREFPFWQRQWTKRLHLGNNKWNNMKFVIWYVTSQLNLAKITDFFWNLVGSCSVGSKNSIWNEVFNLYFSRYSQFAFLIFSFFTTSLPHFLNIFGTIFAHNHKN